MTQDAILRQLEALGAFAPLLKNPQVPFGTWQPWTGSGTAEDPFTLPWFCLSKLGQDFVAMTYQAGWILDDFDWATWARGREGQRLTNDRTAVAEASREQLARLLTALVRQDRFVEGALSNTHDTGLLLAIAERAERLRWRK